MTLQSIRTRVPHISQSTLKTTNHSVNNDSTKIPHFEVTNTAAKTQKRSHQLQAEVNGKFYKVLRKIGAGGSAKVYECFEPTAEQIVALKVINIANADPRTKQSIFNEQSLLTRLQDCQHVVRVYASEYKANIGELLIVMEKGDADLAQVLETRNKIDGLFIRTCWHGMLTAVSEIHKRGVVHADLKPVNFILVRGVIKLIDFGIANSVEPDETSLIRDYQIGTINYMAPETLKNDPTQTSHRKILTTLENTETKQKKYVKYGPKADIWSLGCILYNFVYGRPPFDKHNDILSKLQAITNPNQTIEFPKIYNPDLMQTMRSCLQYNPADRPTADELLSHPFLSRVLDM